MLAYSYQQPFFAPEERKTQRSGESELDFALRVSAGDEDTPEQRARATVLANFRRAEDEFEWAIRASQHESERDPDAELAAAIAASLAAEDEHRRQRDEAETIALVARLARDDERRRAEDAETASLLAFFEQEERDAVEARRREEEASAHFFAQLRFDADDRRAEEEQTAARFAGVVQSVLPSERLADGRVVVGGAAFRPRECGAGHGGHTNLCGYLSLTGGDGEAAVALKLRLAAALAAAGRGDFGGPSTMIDTEVFWAFVRETGTPLCVYSVPTGRAVCFRTEQSRGEMVYLEHSGGHHRRLEPA